MSTAVEQLQEYIDAFINAYNETAEPFAWTKEKVHQQWFENCRFRPEDSARQTDVLQGSVSV